MAKFLRKNYLIFLGFLMLFHLGFLLKLRFTAWPEMLLWPYLMIKGWLPYTDIAIAHTPLMIVKLAVFFKIFGVGILQLKTFTLILIMLLDILVYWISKKLWGVKTAIVAVGFFAFWQIFFEGNGLWFDLFMGVAALASFYFAKSKFFIWAGVFWALAFISKQTAVWFLFPIGLELLKNTKELKKFVLGVLWVIIPSTLILWKVGILPDFYKWAIDFGIFVLPKAQGQVQLPDLKNLAISLFPFTVFLPIFVMNRKESLSLLLWSLAGMMGALPRFEYFHFQPALPYLAIGSSLIFIGNWHKKEIAKVFIPIYVIGSLYLFGGFFMRNFGEGTRFFEGDVEDVTAYVKSNTQENDKIFVLNYWDNVYALSGTVPATRPWIPQLSWYMSAPGVQEKMVSDLTTIQPVLILENSYESIGLGSYKPVLVNDYVAKNYKLKERVYGVNILTPR
jgi:hypothetical protein